MTHKKLGNIDFILSSSCFVFPSVLHKCLLGSFIICGLLQLHWNINQAPLNHGQPQTHADLKFRDESSVYIFQKAAWRIVRVRSPSRARQQIAAWVDGSASYWSKLMDPGQANPFKTGLWRGREQRHWSSVGLNRSSSGHSIMGQ